MGYSKSEKNSRKSNNNNTFDIPTGLVAKRREELIKAGFSGYGAKTTGHTSSDQIQNNSTIEEVTAPNTFETDLTEPAQDKFPTLHRPMMATRRLPSREKGSFSRSKNILFVATDDSGTPDLMNQEQSNPNLVALLKHSVNKANSHYQEHLAHGLHQLNESGWLSWLRHGDEGQKHAEELNDELQKLDSVESILKKLNTFFRKPDTRYHYHSLTSYLLNELNTLLENLHYKSYRPEATEHYQIKSWSCVAIELHKIRLGIPPQEHTTQNTVTI